MARHDDELLHMVKELLGRQAPAPVFNIHGNSGTIGGGSQGPERQSVADQMGYGHDDKDDPFEYFVHINKQDTFDGDKRTGWDKTVSRTKEPKAPKPEPTKRVRTR